MSSSGKGWLELLNFITKLAHDREAYTGIKKDPELRNVSTYLGRIAIGRFVIFIITYILAILCIAGAFKVNLAIIGNIMIFVMGVAAALFALEYFILFLNAAIKQFIVNKKFISIACLLLVFVAIAAVVLILLALNQPLKIFLG